MNLYCVEFILWKRTATFGVRYSLKLVCWLIAVLGGMLFANESHAQTCDITAVPGDRVVLQNVNWLNVRSEPRINDNKIGKVYNGDEGTLKRDPRGKYVIADGKYVWHYVKWDHLRNAGWTAGLIDDQPDDGDNTIKWISTVLEADQKDAIAEALFNGENSRNYIHHYQTNHDYNDYGCNANWGSVHWYPSTGHSGWDVAAHAGAVPFYSLTAGELLLPDKSGETDGSNTIAVYDKDSDMTILYLHAEHIDDTIRNSKDRMISVGDELGIQGKAGNATGVHVHIEIQQGKSMKPSAQSPQTGKVFGEETINPIPCLYRWVIGARVEGFLPWDVNHDGQVDWRDYTAVFMAMLRDKYQAQHDLNCDGEVNWADVNIVWANRTAWLAPVANADAAPPADQTLLLPNYPNPFNPETWIPYRLAEDAFVTLTIYDGNGRVVRTFDVGHQVAAFYESRSKAIYWDGRNEFGEQVASGLYFYHLSAGDYSATRRMLIVK